jgi:hypothetical protein
MMAADLHVVSSQPTPVAATPTAEAGTDAAAVRFA